MIIDEQDKKIQELNQKIDKLKKEVTQKEVEIENYKCDLRVLLTQNQLECAKKEKNHLIDKMVEMKMKFLAKEKKEIEFLKKILSKMPNLPKEIKEFTKAKEESAKKMELEISCFKTILNKKN